MARKSPSEYLSEVRDRLATMRFHGDRERFSPVSPVKQFRSLFPYLARSAAGQLMFPPRKTLTDAVGIETFITHLADRCDGAKSRDDRGFDQLDASEGHRLAAKLSDHSRLSLTASEREWALKAARKYHKQLSSHFGNAYDHAMASHTFRFTVAADEQSQHVQHIRYHDDTKMISFSLPTGLRPYERQEIITEVWALTRATGVNLHPGFQEAANALKRDWDRNREIFSFLQNDDGARNLVDILVTLGFTRDDRIEPALLSSSSAYLKVRSELGARHEGRLLIGYLYHIAENADLRSEVDEYFLRMGSDDLETFEAVNLSKKNKFGVQCFYVGEAVVDGLEEILDRHGVQGVSGMRLALDDPRRVAHQHPDLAAPSAVRQRSLSLGM